MAHVGIVMTVLSGWERVCTTRACGSWFLGGGGSLRLSHPSLRRAAEKHFSLVLSSSGAPYDVFLKCAACQSSSRGTAWSISITGRLGLKC